MARKNSLAPALLIAALMTTTALPINAAFALPDQSDPGISAANHPTAAEARLALSKDGFDAWRDVRGARIAMFNGNANLALDLIKAAQKSLAAADQLEGEATQIVTTKIGNEEQTMHWVAIDGNCPSSQSLRPLPLGLVEDLGHLLG